MIHDEDIRNTSGNRPFQDILQARLSRRDVLMGGLATAATTFFAGSGGVLAAPGVQGNRGRLLGFAPALNDDDAVPQISADYEYQVMIPWGTPLDPSAGLAPFADVYPLSAEEQEQRIGIGHDGMYYFPIGGSSEHGVLCINHEFGTNAVVLGKNDPESLDEVRSSQAAHGVSVVEIANNGGTWEPVVSDKSRRITVNTPVEFSGPVAGHPLLENAADNAPAGTVNNCANGFTPWGTYLTCEENFNGYFGASGEFSTPERDRYGFSSGGFGYGWFRFDERFDLSNPDYANEANRFGWVVEIDPMDPDRKPVKRTALGRVKHEGVALTIGKGGRAVAYMGDDQRFDYIYKFVSDGNWEEMVARGISPLDVGRLYVARFNENGTGDWLELTIENPDLAARFEDQAEVLTFARIAADILGATPMDRPEWTTVAPNGDVFCTLTNNSRRTEPDAANPEAPNSDGHIIRWHDSAQHTGVKFKWDIFVIASTTRGTEYEFTDPDGLWADPDGRLFIQTDGGQPNGQDQMLVADIFTGEIRRIFSGVSGDEITGITVTPDQQTLFANSQHPGVALPGFENDPVPRDSTFVITRIGGGTVGS